MRVASVLLLFLLGGLEASGQEQPVCTTVTLAGDPVHTMGTTTPPFGSGDGRFDLRGVRLITPAGLIQLAAALHALNTAGGQPTLVVDDDSVRSYLARVGFTGVVQPVCQIEPPLPLFSTAEYLYGSSHMLIADTFSVLCRACDPDISESSRTYRQDDPLARVFHAKTIGAGRCARPEGFSRDWVG